MPVPIYMICCESGSVDESTHQISHFKVIEAYQIDIGPLQDQRPNIPPTVIVGGFKFLLVTVWGRKDDDKPTDEFEAEVGFTRPDGESENLMYKGLIRFEKPRHRIIVDVNLIPTPNLKSGKFCFEGRIRKVGSKTWLRQRYEIVVNVSNSSVKQVAKSPRRQRINKTRRK